MKILVYGAGVLGSLCAARMQEAGKDVTLLARGVRLEFLQQNGIVLEHALRRERKTVPIEVVEKLGRHDVYDLVVVVMGRYQVPSILPILAANDRVPNILFMGNNAAGVGEYQQALGAERVLLGFYMAGGALKEGTVWYADDTEQGRRKSPLGEPDGSLSPRLEAVCQVFESSGIPVQLSPNIDAWLKTHVAIILPMAAAVYQAGGELSSLADDRPTLDLMIKGWKEALGVLTALGIPILPPVATIYRWAPAALLMPLVRKALRNPAAAISFAHSENARPEMHCLAGQLGDLAQRSRRKTPALERLADAI